MSEAAARPRRRTALWLGAAGAALVLIVILVIGFVNRTPSGSGVPVGTPSSSATAANPSGAVPSSTGSAASATPVPTASVPAATSTGSPTVVPTQAVKTTKVPLDNKAKLGKNVIVKVTKFDSVKGKAQGPGEIAGPALRITLSVTNGSSEEISMDNALVNLYYGKEETPASPLSGPGAKPLRRPIPAGGSAVGRYVFSVPKAEQRQLSVEFSYTTDEPTVIFSGSR